MENCKVAIVDGKKCLCIEVPEEASEGMQAGDHLNLQAVDFKALLKAIAPVLISLLQQVLVS